MPDSCSGYKQNLANGDFIGLIDIGTGYIHHFQRYALLIEAQITDETLSSRAAVRDALIEFG